MAVQQRTNTEDTYAYIFILQPMQNLAGTSLTYGKKLEWLEENTYGVTCKLHTEKPKAGSNPGLWLQGVSANCYTTYLQS